MTDIHAYRKMLRDSGILPPEPVRNPDELAPPLGKLPETFVKKQLEGGEIHHFMGVPLDELSHDELMAVAIAGWKAERLARESAYKRGRFASDMMKLAGGRRP